MVKATTALLPGLQGADMPQPLVNHAPNAFDARQAPGGAHINQGLIMGGHPSPEEDYLWGGVPPSRELEPHDSYVASCAVDSAQHIEEWNGPSMPSATAAAGGSRLPPPLRASAVPTALTNHAASTPASEDPLGSAAAAAAALCNPWAWLSDVALGGGGGSTSSCSAVPAPGSGQQGAELHQYQHCHGTSRRLFISETPKMSVQHKLQQQAEALQAQLAAATQQLQMHNIAFAAPPPAVTMAG